MRSSTSASSTPSWSESGKPKLANAYVDTVSVARRKFPSQRASLDALCERFSVDNSNRVKHGALLDSELLAEVYLELSGGRQRVLGLAAEIGAGRRRSWYRQHLPVRPSRPAPSGRACGARRLPESDQRPAVASFLMAREPPARSCYERAGGPRSKTKRARPSRRRRPASCRRWPRAAGDRAPRSRPGRC